MYILKYHRKCNKARTKTSTTLLSHTTSVKHYKTFEDVMMIVGKIKEVVWRLLKWLVWILNKKERLKPVCPISTESVGDYASVFAFSFPLWPHYAIFSFCFSVSGKLFATASSSCANVLTVRSSTSGMIYSNRDGSHSNNMYCSWSISSNTNLELIFFRLDRESSFDSVYVYDGGSSSSPLIGQYHRNSSLAAITSSSNQLFVIFTSAGSIIRSGFAASYHGKEYLHSCWPWEITANWKKGKILRIKKIKETITVSIALKVKIVSHCSRFNTNLNV